MTYYRYNFLDDDTVKIIIDTIESIGIFIKTYQNNNSNYIKLECNNNNNNNNEFLIYIFKEYIITNGITITASTILSLEEIIIELLI